MYIIDAASGYILIYTYITDMNIIYVSNQIFKRDEISIISIIRILNRIGRVCNPIEFKFVLDGKNSIFCAYERPK